MKGLVFHYWHCPVCNKESVQRFASEELAQKGLKGHMDLWHEGMEDHGADQDD